MSVEVIIVAGGSGKRLKADLPKALVPLKGKALLVYCLKVFNSHPGINGIVVVGVKEHLRVFDRLAFPFKKVHAVIAGGEMRSDSVKCGLNKIVSHQP